MPDIVNRPLDLASRRQQIPDDVLQIILDSLRGVQYGQVTISVQEGHVVQIERMERRRLKT